MTTPAEGPQSNFTLTIMVRKTPSVRTLFPSGHFLVIVNSVPKVCQVDDRLKYSVTSAVIRMLSPNRFPLVFNTTSFKGFVPQSSGSASIVSTNGNQVLQVQVWDNDFPDVRVLLLLHLASGGCAEDSQLSFNHRAGIPACATLSCLWAERSGLPRRAS